MPGRNSPGYQARYQRARRRAWAKLAERHRDEYEELFAEERAKSESEACE